MSEIIGPEARALDRARISRDPRFDGKFFIAVTSTGIYCRPVCPVRSPKNSNVRYYATAAAAAEAGFRPCLRCRPEAAPGSPAWFGTSAVVRRALRLIDEGLLDCACVDDLAMRLGIGVRHLHRLFVQHIGASPIAVAQTRRLHFAKRLLDETSLPVTEIALAAGFGSLRRFNSAFLQTYGRAPRDIRKTRAADAPAGTNEVVLKLAFRPPYDWAQVRDFLAARALPTIERVDEHGYWRTVKEGDAPAVIHVHPIENVNALELRVHGAAPAALFHISSAVRRMFDLAADPAGIAAAFAGDPLLAIMVKQRPGLRIPGAWDPFECTVRAIVGQQVSVAGARTLLTRIVAHAGRPVQTSDPGLTHLFPSAGDLATADLNGLGLTGARITAIQALAYAVATGKLAFDAPSEQVVAEMSSLSGIADWTAQYVALRALNEPDAFPAGDLVLRKMAGSGSPLSPRALAQRADAWRPWRGYAALHLWRAAALAQK